MNGIIKQGRAWIPVLKAGVLFVLPLPLVAAFVVALLTGDLARFAYISGALAAFYSAGFLTWRALAAQARYYLGERTDPPVLPLKLISGVLTSAGAALASAAGGYEPVGMLVYAALAAAGYFSFYGRDLRRRSFSVAAVDGIDANAVTAQLKQAHGRLQGIDAAARAIAVPEFTERLHRITAIGQRILEEIERDPRDASRARRFLNLYLDGAERVTTEYARMHRHVRNRPLEENFRNLLIDMESTFEKQHQKLLDNDLLSLDVDVEVLNARLKQEGL